MSVNDRLNAVIGHPQQVEVQAIERELAELWQAATAGSPGADDAEVMRACILNLLVYVPDPAGLDAVSDVISALTASHPCRAIIMVADPDASQAGTEAWITAHCEMPAPGRPQVCCEQITIVGHGRACYDLHGTAVPLLQPDLPTFLWWLGDPPLHDHMFRILAACSDRMVVDSATFHNTVETMDRLAEWISPRPALSDLNWARLTAWRSLVAQFFDAPHLQRYLADLDQVEVSFCPGPDVHPNSAQACLLVGWLASRLGWRALGGRIMADADAAMRSGQLLYRLEMAGARPVHVAVTVDTETCAVAGNLTTVRLHAGSATPPARFMAEQSQDGKHVVTTVEIDGMQPVSRVTPIEARTEAQIVAGDLDVLGHDPVFEAALKVIATPR